jgi:hypothetical protein
MSEKDADMVESKQGEGKESMYEEYLQEKRIIKMKLTINARLLEGS